jgi:hypothetical protein
LPIQRQGSPACYDPLWPICMFLGKERSPVVASRGINLRKTQRWTDVKMISYDETDTLHGMCSHLSQYMKTFRSYLIARVAQGSPKFVVTVLIHHIPLTAFAICCAHC